MSDNVEYYTRLAGEKLHKRQDDDAISDFREAVKHAKKSNDLNTVCKCKFNLGAALISIGRASEGLKVLESVTPSKDDSLLTGDLWYNMCLAREELDSTADAIKCIQLAIKCYDECSNGMVLKAGSACRLASLYTELREFEKAAEAYAVAASTYAMANDTFQQAVCLFQQARLLGCCKEIADVIPVADQCAEICHDQRDAGVDIGQLLNDLGLFYAQCKEHEKALKCFQQAQKIFQWNSKDRKLEAVILQNIGAIYNCLGKYELSIEHNRQASELYAQISCRSGQGQCFSNMAYAFSQLPDVDMASEFYLHALQAARDTGDRNNEYQALEGLSSVAFQKHTYDRSCEYLKSALIAVSADSSVQSPTVQQRLVNKLADVMQLQLVLHNQHTQQQMQVPTEQYRPLVSTDYMIDSSFRSSNAEKPDSEQDNHDTVDTVDERLVKQEMSKQLSRSNEDSDGSTEQDNDDDDDDDDSESDDSDEDSDSDDSDRKEVAGSMPHYTAPHAPSKGPNDTYLVSTEQKKSDAKSKQQEKYSETSRQDPNYMSLRVSQSTEPQPPSLPARLSDSKPEADKGTSSRQSQKANDTVNLPKSSRKSSRESQACIVM